ncbi:MAG: sigma-70 family RNA polymerase sigma factor [Rhodospirillales bacterium]|nr:sigma-70 family RNA polymerase sigma factor [Rhodospirillales bacterium]
MNDVRKNLERHLPALQRYAMSLACDPAAAQDLVQECAMRALAKANLYKPGTNLRAWLFTILHNLHVSEARRRQRWPAAKDPDLVIERISTPAPQPAAVMLNDVGDAISELPRQQQRLLMSIGVEGKSYDEASDEFGIPLGTVKSGYARARKALAERVSWRPAAQTRGA